MFARTMLKATIECYVGDVVDYVATLYSDEGEPMFSEGFDSEVEAREWLWNLCLERSRETGGAFFPEISVYG